MNSRSAMHAPYKILSEAMDAYLSLRFREAPLTTAHIQSLQQGLKQAERRQLVFEETVEAFLRRLGKGSRFALSRFCLTRQAAADHEGTPRYFNEP